MKEVCANAVNVAAKNGLLGRELTKGELKDIEEFVASARRELFRKNDPAFTGLSPREKTLAVGKLAKERYLQSVVEGHEKYILDLQKKAARNDDLDRWEPGKKFQTMYDSTFFHSGNNIGMMTLDKRIEGIQMDAMRYLNQMAGGDAGKFFGIVGDNAKQDNITREMFGQNSGDAEAAFAVQVYHKLNDMMLDRMDRAGIGVHRLDNYGLPNTWDMFRVAAVSADKYAEIHLPFVDRNAYVNAEGKRMDDAELTEFLKKVWETNATDGANKRGDEESRASGRGIGLTRNQPRQLFFKDAESYTKSMAMFGKENMSVYDKINTHIMRMARDIGLAETWGRDPEATFQQVLNKAFTEDTRANSESGKDEKTIKQIERDLEKKRTHALKMFKTLMHGSRPEDALWARRMANVRSYLSNVTMFGGPTALPDIVGLGMTAHMNNLSVKGVLGDFAKGFANTEDAHRIMRDTGVMSEAWQGAMNRIATEDAGAGLFKVMSQWSQKLALFHAFDRGAKFAYSSHLMDKIGQLSRDLSYQELAASDHAYLINRLGLTERDWNVMKLAEVDAGPQGKYALMTPQAIYDIPDAQLHQMVTNELIASAARRTTELAKIAADAKAAKTARDAARDAAIAAADSSPEGQTLRADKARASAAFDAAITAADATRDAAITAAKAGYQAALQALKNVRDPAARKQAAATRDAAVDAAKAKWQADTDAATAARKTALEAAENTPAAKEHKLMTDFAEREHEQAKKRDYATEMAARKRVDARSSMADILQTHVDKLNARTAQEQTWLADANAKMQAGLAKATQWLADMNARGQAKDAVDQARTQARIDLVNALVKKAKLQAAKARFQMRQDANGRIDQIMFGDAPNNTPVLVRQLTNSAYWNGKVLQRRLDDLDIRIKEIKDSLASKQEAHQEKMDRNTQKVADRFDAIVKDLQERSDRYDEAAKRRQDYVDEYEKALAAVVGNEMANARSNAATQLMAMIASELQVAARGSMDSTLREKNGMGLLKGDAGTKMGEAVRFFWLMRQAAIGYSKTHLWDVPQSLAAQHGQASAWMYRAKFLALSTVVGAMVEELKSVVLGRDAPQRDEKYLLKAMANGVSFGIWGDLLLSDPTEGTAGQFAKLLLGVSYSKMDELYSVFNQIKRAGLENMGAIDPGTGNKVGAQTTNAALRLLPFQNNWLFKTAFDRIVRMQLMDMIQPGYSADVQKRQMRLGRTFYWPPTSTLPQRLPHLTQ